MSLHRVFAFLCVLCVAIVAVHAQSGSSGAVDDALDEELIMFGSSLGVEVASTVKATSYEFVNPSNISVPTNVNFTILRNHTVAAGGTTGFWDLVTRIGNTNCTDMRAQLRGDSVSCVDKQIEFYSLSNVNIDPNYMTAQFLYVFNSGSSPRTSAIHICTFRPWEQCDPTYGNATTIPLVVYSAENESVATFNRDEAEEMEALVQQQ